MKKMFATLTITLMTLLGGFSAFAADVSSQVAADGGAGVGITVKLLLQGMLGIFVVMGLIYLVIVLLNKATGNKSKSEKEEK